MHFFRSRSRQLRQPSLLQSTQGYVASSVFEPPATTTGTGHPRSLHGILPGPGVDGFYNISAQSAATRAASLTWSRSFSLLIFFPLGYIMARSGIPTPCRRLKPSRDLTASVPQSQRQCLRAWKQHQHPSQWHSSPVDKHLVIGIRADRGTGREVEDQTHVPSALPVAVERQSYVTNYSIRPTISNKVDGLPHIDKAGDRPVS